VNAQELCGCTGEDQPILLRVRGKKFPQAFDFVGGHLLTSS
jgi:hypothetical protein